MNVQKNENNVYQKIIASLKKRSKGATIADISAATALPLSTVREMLPKAADEFKGRLEVTESGEILYSFPNGFTSRYRGFGATAKRFFRKFAGYAGIAAVFLFKAWIMVMLVGYFVLFIAIALAAVLLFMAAQARGGGRGGYSYGGGNRGYSYGGGNRGGSAHAGVNPFGMIWRIWFFSELTRPRRSFGGGQFNPAPAKEKRPMHKAVFSFVFGDGDPNKDWQDRENKAVITYIQANNGVISLPEYMAFCGKNNIQAEESLLAFCAHFGGSPEATGEGTIVYRFDELLLRADKKNFAELSVPVQQLKQFSANEKKLNTWFIVINAVNLIFGSYFLYHSFNTGLLLSEEHFQAAPYLYAFTQFLILHITQNPMPVLMIGLGLIPFAFSVLFWVIPALRRYFETLENEKLKLANFKRLGFNRIWSRPFNVKPGDIKTDSAECRPRNASAAWDSVIKEMGAISSPDVEINPNGETLYSFSGLDYEKKALEKYRAGIDMSRSKLGNTVFDSGA